MSQPFVPFVLLSTDPREIRRRVHGNDRAATDLGEFGLYLKDGLLNRELVRYRK